jgi:hypothetical protein
MKDGEEQDGVCSQDLQYTLSCDSIKLPAAENNSIMMS